MAETVTQTAETTEKKKEEKDNLLPIERQKKQLELMQQTLKSTKEAVDSMIQVAKDRGGFLLFNQQSRSRYRELYKIKEDTEKAQKRVEEGLKRVNKLEKRNDDVVNKKIQNSIDSIQKDLENLLNRVKSLQVNTVKQTNNPKQEESTVNNNATQVAQDDRDDDDQNKTNSAFSEENLNRNDADITETSFSQQIDEIETAREGVHIPSAEELTELAKENPESTFLGVSGKNNDIMGLVHGVNAVSIDKKGNPPVLPSMAELESQSQGNVSKPPLPAEMQSIVDQIDVQKDNIKSFAQSAEKALEQASEAIRGLSR